MTRALPQTTGPYRLDGRRVVVVGLARSGLAAARLCAARGAKVTAVDRRPAEALDLALLQGVEAELRLGEHDAADFTAADLVVLSPGVPLQLPPVQAAVAAGVPVIGEVELAASFLQDVPVVGITGTNGKSTTTALLGRILERAGLRPFVGGNIGRALSEAVLGREPPGALVLELSSFQLETIRRFRPAVGVLLNLTPDHLDRHGRLDAYAAAKKRLFENQTADDHAVVNGDDPVAAGLAEGIAARVHRFQAGAAPAGGCGFGPAGLVVDLGGPGGSGGPGGGDAESYRVAGPALRGPHNLANAAAAVLAARLMGAAPDAVQSGLDRFDGLPHRLERVRVLDGVEWINDSKATNLDSAATALAAFTRGVIWIAGGRGKGAPYAPLADRVRGRVDRILGIGEDGPAVVDALADAAPGEVAHTLEAAVERARALARPGDVVLLSPACASFDQFRDYEHRGAAFRALVEALS